MPRLPVVALLLTLAVGLALPSLLIADAPPPSWPELLLAESSSADQRTRALEAVKSIASGEPGEAETREAIFALAEYWKRLSDDGLTVEASQAINTATALYIDDPRTPGLLRVLAGELSRGGDPYGAHTAYQRLVGVGAADESPSLLARAAVNAARAGDMAAAFDWSQRVDPETVGTDERILLHLARTASGQAMGQTGLALESVEILLTEAEESLHTNELALLAAAETLEAVGLLERAIPLFYRFISVHPRAYRRPHAMYMLGHLYARTEQPEFARAHWTWLLESYPDSPQAHQARMELLNLDDASRDESTAKRYITVISTAHTTERGLEACRAFIDNFVGGGRPLAVADALIDAATPDPRRPIDGLGRTLIEHCLELSLPPVIGLLDARGDVVSIAAIASRVHAMGVSLPDDIRYEVETARRALGLPATPAGAFDAAIAEARQAAEASDWQTALDALERGRLLDQTSSSSTHADADRLEIEILWRAERVDEALARAETADERPGLSPARERLLRVLVADILFAEGRIEPACADYRRAAEQQLTPWVDAQLDRCKQTGVVARAAQ